MNLRPILSLAITAALALGLPAFAHASDLPCDNSGNTTAKTCSDGNGNLVLAGGNASSQITDTNDPASGYVLSESQLVGSNNTLAASRNYNQILGGNNTATGALGLLNIVGYQNAVSSNEANIYMLGSGNNVTGGDGGNWGISSIGGSNTITQSSAQVVGVGNTVNNSTLGIVIGTQNQMDGAKLSTVIGFKNNATGSAATIIGNRSAVSANYGVAIGSDATLGADATNSVVLGNFSSTDRANVVEIGGRVLSGMSAGVLDTDGVNVSQLYGFASALGGGATWSGGTLTAPSFSLTGGTFSDVGSALTYLDNRISGLPTGTTPPPPPATDGTVVHYDGSDKSQVTLAGADGTRVSNVADGVEATDAANVRQVRTAKQEAIDAANSYADAGDARTLNSAERYADQGDAVVKDWAKAYTDEQAARTLHDANAYTDLRFKQLNDRFARVNAMGSAQTSMAANFRGDNSISAGVGFAGGHNAIAVGYRHVTQSGHVSFSVHGAIAGAERTLGAGVAYSW